MIWLAAPGRCLGAAFFGNDTHAFTITALSYTQPRSGLAGEGLPYYEIMLAFSLAIPHTGFSTTGGTMPIYKSYKLILVEVPDPLIPGDELSPLMEIDVYSSFGDDNLTEIIWSALDGVDNIVKTATEVIRDE